MIFPGPGWQLVAQQAANAAKTAKQKAPEKEPASESIKKIHTAISRAIISTKDTSVPAPRAVSRSAISPPCPLTKKANTPSKGFLKRALASVQIFCIGLAHVIHHINARFADATTDLAAVGTEHVSRTLEIVSPIIDFAAAGTTSLSIGIKCCGKIKKRYKLGKLNGYLKKDVDKDGNELNPKKRAELTAERDALKEELHSDKYEFIFSVLSSISYLIGTIAVKFAAAELIGSVFGLVGFGVAFATSKAIALKEDIAKGKEMKAACSWCDPLKGSPSEQAKKAKRPAALKALASLKSHSLAKQKKRELRLSKIENMLGIAIGTSAAVAGTLALTAASVASAGLLPFIVCLGASAAFGIGALYYKHMARSESRTRAATGMQLSIVKMRILFSGKTKELEIKKADLETKYRWHSYHELIKEPEAHMNTVNTFLAAKESPPKGSELEHVLKSIAKEARLFNDAGEPDIEALEREHIMDWLISESCDFAD